MNRFLVSLVAALISLNLLSAQTAGLDDGRDDGFTMTKGRVVCLDAAGQPVDSLFACSQTNAGFGLVSRGGKLYRFLLTDSITALFTDSRVRQRELQITARWRAGDQLEVIKVQSIKEGKLYDIFYFCEVCNIKAYAPGLCPCCRNDLDFMETP